jgi:hypothetical protein
LIVVSGATGEASTGRDGVLSVGDRIVVGETRGVTTVSEIESVLAAGVVVVGRPQPAVRKSTAIAVRQQIAVILAAGPKRSIVFLSLASLKEASSHRRER